MSTIYSCATESITVYIVDNLSFHDSPLACLSQYEMSAAALNCNNNPTAALSRNSNPTATLSHNNNPAVAGIHAADSSRFHHDNLLKLCQPLDFFHCILSSFGAIAMGNCKNLFPGVHRFGNQVCNHLIHRFYNPSGLPNLANRPLGSSRHHRLDIQSICHKSLDIA